MIFYLIYDNESIFSSTFKKEEVQINSYVTNIWYVFESRSFI